MGIMAKSNYKQYPWKQLKTAHKQGLKMNIDNFMTACFLEAYRILKPGRWMTVEFSNTNASVWNGYPDGFGGSRLYYR